MHFSASRGFMLPQYLHLIFSAATARNSSTFSEYLLKRKNLATSMTTPPVTIEAQTRYATADPVKYAGKRRNKPKNRSMMENIRSIMARVSVGEPLGGSIGSSPSTLMGLPQERQNIELSGISDLQPGHFN